MKKKWTKLLIIFLIVTALTTVCYVYSKNKQTSVFQLRGIEIEHEQEFGGVYLHLDAHTLDQLGIHHGDALNIFFSNGARIGDVPYYSGYFTKTGSPLLVDYQGYPYLKLAINNGDDAWIKYGLSEDDTVTVKLAQRGKYLEIQQAREITYKDDRSEYETDEMFANFRAVNVGNMKQDLVYRSASICDNQHNRATYVDNLASTKNIKTIINLADSQEKIFSYMADSSYNTPYFDNLYKEGNVHLAQLNTNYKNEKNKAKIADLMREIISKEGPFLIHCTEGKDRTGFILILLESLSGATKEELENDYMMTYYNYYHIDEETYPEKYKIIVKYIFQDLIETMIGSQEDMSTNLKESAKEYLISCGLSEDEVGQLEVKLTKKGQ